MSEKATLERVRAEYLEMPGLRLTLEQAQRLCGVERALCRSILEELVNTRFLCVRAGGLYVRLTDGDASRSQSIRGNRHRSN
jgi:hypothetical protein